MNTKPSASYTLPTGATDAGRLDVIQLVYGPVSFRGLDAGGIGAARRVADIGCGTGTMTRWMAEHMAPAGQVDAIDISEEQLAVARSTAPAPKAGKITFSQASAYETGLPKGMYDLAFTRLVLCHLQEPAKAVAAMADLLKPGGRLVLVDMEVRSVFTMPPSTHYERYIASVPPHARALGVDYNVGIRLPELLASAGLKVASIIADQPIFNEGPGKSLWENTWRSVLPFRVKAGSMTQEEGEDILSGMAAHNARPDVWVAVAKMFAAVGVK
jgi:SAM-dependent methyltransferase